MSAIYHIVSRKALPKAPSGAAASLPDGGEYRSESLSSEGFIHFSSLHQVLEVADSYYHGQTGLVLLEVEPARLRAQLRYEPPVHPVASDNPPSSDRLFPHLYGALNLDAVVGVYDFEPDASGRFSLPAGLDLKIDSKTRKPRHV